MRVISESWSPEQALQWAFNTYGTDVAVASAFGPEGIVVLDIAAGIRRDLRVFTLDTNYLFPETFYLVEKVERRYGIQVERVLPSLTSETQATLYGPELWSRNPDQCCRLRKVEPLKRKLTQLRAWVTAIRRDQTPARRNAGRIEWDAKFGLMKINPLVDWTSEMVWSYIHEHRLDYNPLHDRNYPSIGCVHCTRPVRDGEDPRAGRWSGFSKSECGLHGMNRTG
jgi:phosphoadenosine phosphosulfate reductase